MIQNANGCREHPCQLDAGQSGTDKPGTGQLNTGQILQRNKHRDRSTGVWAYISPSRLNTWLRCPRAFKLRYVDGIRSPPSTSMFVGKVVHAGLEYYYRHQQKNEQLSAIDVVKQIDVCWQPWAEEETVAFADAAEETKLRKQAAVLIAAYIQQLPRHEPAPTMVETRLEVPLVDPFTGESLGIPLLGIVDLVVSDKHGPIICDFKTSSRSTAPVEIIHEVQLTAYAYLFRQLAHDFEAGLEIRSLIKTKVPKIEYHRFGPRTSAHLRRFFQIVRAYLDDLDRGSFVYRPGFSCTMCDFRDGPCVELSA